MLSGGGGGGGGGGGRGGDDSKGPKSDFEVCLNDF